MAAEDEARAGRQALEDAYAAAAVRMLEGRAPEEQQWGKVGLSLVLVYAVLHDENGERRSSAAALALLLPHIRLRATQDHAALQWRNALELGLPFLRWVAIIDGRTRASHRRLNGTSQRVGVPFHTITGASLLLPGDTSAPLDEWYNCRCVVVPSKRKT